MKVEIGDATLYCGDCVEVLRTLPDGSVDAVVTDPPYGLSFMGKRWDYDVPSEEVWRECLRVLKPGGHLLAFAGTRTQHRMAVRIEDAGFEIRDMIAWVYGSGFPKSLDVSKAIDRAAGATREAGVPGPHYDKRGSGSGSPCFGDGIRDKSTALLTAPATEAAHQWQGWGTALKPALEPITVARKPLVGTVAANVLEYGTGAINVDGCRVATPDGKPAWHYPNGPGGNVAQEIFSGLNSIRTEYTAPTSGRWPANLIHDGSEEVVGLFPGEGEKSAARFMYCAKASKTDRDDGCEGLAAKNRADHSAWVRKCNVCGDTFCDPATSKPHCGHDDFGWVEPSPRRNHHPTVKPTDLMRHLCRLVTPPGGVVFDPFTGSGSTGKAALLEGFRFIGIEREAEYVEIARARIAAAIPEQNDLFA